MLVDFDFLQHVDIHTVVQISRIDEQKINVALLNNISKLAHKEVRKNTYNSNGFHVRYERRKIS